MLICGRLLRRKSIASATDRLRICNIQTKSNILIRICVYLYNKYTPVHNNPASFPVQVRVQRSCNSCTYLGGGAWELGYKIETQVKYTKLYMQKFVFSIFVISRQVSIIIIIYIYYNNTENRIAMLCSVYIYQLLRNVCDYPIILACQF